MENTTALIVLCSGKFNISATASIVLALGVSTTDNSCSASSSCFITPGLPISMFAA